MQLLDPSNIKRSAEIDGEDLNTDKKQLITQFDRVHKTLDIIVLQEELKQSMIEG